MEAWRSERVRELESERVWERKRAAMGMDRKVQVEEWLEGKLKVKRSKLR